MRRFELILRDASGSESIPDVVSFVGEDASGTFGILGGHARMMTSLTFGLARFRPVDSDWRYIALARGVLYFCDDVLEIDTRRYLIGDDYERLSHALGEQLAAEEQALKEAASSLRRMEEEMLARLWELQRGGST